MTDNRIEKIRAGIKRLKSQLLRGACSSQIAMETSCKEEAYDEVLAILDSLQEEPNITGIKSKHATGKLKECIDNAKKAKLNAMLDESLSKETKESWNERLGKEKPKFKVGNTIRKINDGLEAKVTSVDNSGFIYAACEDWEQIIYPKDWELVEEPVSEEWIEELRTKLNSMSKEDFKKVFDKYAIGFNEEPVSEDLKKEIDNYVRNNFFGSETTGFFSNKTKEELNDRDVADIARHFVNWQKEQMEKNRIAHCNSITNEQAELEDGFVSSHIDKNNCMPTFLDAIEYGMKTAKEQMMKDATEVTVHIEAGNYPYIPQLELYDYDKDVPLAKDGDKYKVVLIKEK